MKVLLTLAATILSSFALAHEFHTPDFCHAQRTDVCVHLGYNEKPEMQKAHEFVVDFVVSDAVAQTIETAEVDLWMPSMGHGSAPVTVQKLAANVYKVTDAYFIMPGDWAIRIALRLKTEQGVQVLNFEIPVMID